MYDESDTFHQSNRTQHNRCCAVAIAIAHAIAIAYITTATYMPHNPRAHTRPIALRAIAKAGTCVLLHEAEEGYAVVSKAAGTGWSTLVQALSVIFKPDSTSGVSSGEDAFPPTPLYPLEKALHGLCVVALSREGLQWLRLQVQAGTLSVRYRMLVHSPGPGHPPPVLNAPRLGTVGVRGGARAGAGAEVGGVGGERGAGGGGSDNGGGGGGGGGDGSGSGQDSYKGDVEGEGEGEDEGEDESEIESEGEAVASCGSSSGVEILCDIVNTITSNADGFYCDMECTVGK